MLWIETGRNEVWYACGGEMSGEIVTMWYEAKKRMTMREITAKMAEMEAAAILDHGTVALYQMFTYQFQDLTKIEISFRKVS